jgi:very-short-patch-repair endonuclease
MDLIRSRARALRKNSTEAEKVLWGHLRFWQVDGCKFRRQQPIGNYIVDFVCLEKKLIIDLDGGQHAEQSSYDGERDAWLRAQGFSVLRFWNNDVLQNVSSVKDAILSELESTPFPILPRKGEGRRLGKEVHRSNSSVTSLSRELLIS